MAGYSRISSKAILKNAARIELVIFDLDGVLLQSVTGSKPFNAMASGIVASDGKMKQALTMIERHHFLTTDWISEFKAAGVDVKDRKLLRDISTAVFEATKGDVGVFQEAKSVIPELSRRIPVAILSNNCRKAADHCVSEIGGFFAAIKTFEDLTRLKPDPEGIRTISEELGICPANILFVGDTQDDLIAANEAGVRMAVAAWSRKHPFQKKISDDIRSIIARRGIFILRHLDEVFDLLPE